MLGVKTTTTEKKSVAYLVCKTEFKQNVLSHIQIYTSNMLVVLVPNFMFAINENMLSTCCLRDSKTNKRHVISMTNEIELLTWPMSHRSHFNGAQSFFKKRETHNFTYVYLPSTHFSTQLSYACVCAVQSRTYQCLQSFMFSRFVRKSAWLAHRTQWNQASNT